MRPSGFKGLAGLTTSVIGAIVVTLVSPSIAVAITQTVELGNVSARYTDRIEPLFPVCRREHRLRITRENQVVFNEQLAFADELEICRTSQPGLRVVDLDGDQEPEVIVDLYTGGAHCCTIAQIYRYNSTTQQYDRLEHFWGDGEGPPLEDFDQDGIPEFRSGDQRFLNRFSSYADAALPLQIWQYRQGELRDVTRNFPEVVYDHTYGLWLRYGEARQQKRDVKGILAAYLANKSLLGQAADGWTLVEEAYQAADRQQFFSELRQFLAEMGYEAPP